MSDTGKLAAALAAFQSEMPVVPKKHTAKVVMKNGGNYSYTYADLADVTEAALPLLTKHGLAFSACPRQTERGYELCGRLLHESGESLDGVLPISGNTPQELGSSITYMRRYLFGCMTGLVTDDDDDGQLSSRPPAKKAAPRKAPDEPPSAGNQPMLENTRKAMFALFGELKIAEEQQLAGINAILGTAYGSRGDLSEAEAKRVVEALRRKKAAA